MNISGKSPWARRQAWELLRRTSLWGQAGGPGQHPDFWFEQGPGFLEMSNTGVAAAYGERTVRLNLDMMHSGHRQDIRDILVREKDIEMWRFALAICNWELSTQMQLRCEWLRASGDTSQVERGSRTQNPEESIPHLRGNWARRELPGKRGGGALERPEEIQEGRGAGKSGRRERYVVPNAA